MSGLDVQYCRRFTQSPGATEFAFHAFRGTLSAWSRNDAISSASRNRERHLVSALTSLSNTRLSPYTEPDSNECKARSTR